MLLGGRGHEKEASPNTYDPVALACTYPGCSLRHGEYCSMHAIWAHTHGCGEILVGKWNLFRVSICRFAGTGRPTALGLPVVPLV